MPARLPTSRQRGQILPMMAILAVVLIAIIGLAIDVGRIMVAKAQLVRAVDAAATLAVPVSPAERQVEVQASKSVDLTFLSVLTLLPGVGLEDPVTGPADAIAGFGILPLDTYMAIDATGSMGDSPCNGNQSNPGCPIKEAKDAAADFADILLEDSPGASYTQVGAGPFRGCYRPPRNYSVCVPVADMVQDLTGDKGVVVSTIDDIEAEGGSGTNVCLGMLKGQEILFGPNGQTASNTERVLVLLSDGDNNYNSTSYGEGAPPAEGRPTTSPQNPDQYVDSNCRSAQTRERELDDRTLDLVNELKDQGVEIYVVGFGVCGNANQNLCNRSQVGGTWHDNSADRNLAKCIASSTDGT